MSEPTRAELRAMRERVIDQLSDDFANDLLDIDEFEDRIDQAHRAEDRSALEKLLSNSSTTTEAVVARPEAAPARPSVALAASPAQATSTMVAILGGAERKGSWRVPGALRTIALLGGAKLDLREAIFAAGVHEINVTAILGGVEIIVPPTVSIECDGASILGGFESVHRAPVEPEPDRPLLRIRGFALLGGVEVQTRLPGESKRQARRREKRRLRAARKELRAAQKQLGK